MQTKSQQDTLHTQKNDNTQKKGKITSIAGDVESVTASHIAGRDVKWFRYNPFGKYFGFS